MGKEVKEKKELKLVTTPRISPMEILEYVQGWISQYKAMSQFENFTPDVIESEWDEIVDSVFKTSTPFLQRRIEGLSSIPVFKEKGMDVNYIDLKDNEEYIKEFIHTYDYTANKDIIFRQYIKSFLSRIPLGFHLGWDSSLPWRDREVIVLRCAWLCKSEYIWDHHMFGGAKKVGLSKEDICGSKVKDQANVTLISAVDELYSDAILSKKTWNSLTQQYNLFQIMDLVFIIGLYIQLATAFNTLKIQNEEIIKESIINEELPSLKGDTDNVRPVRKIGNTKSFRLEEPRITPLNEFEYVKELLMFQNALNRLKYTKRDNETEWEKEIDSLIQWLKGYNLTEVNSLSSFLNLEEKGLDINSINLEDHVDSIKAFIKQEGAIFNLKAVMMKYRKLRLYWIIQASHTTYDSSLPIRDKEILILRIAWLCRAQYEWDHHVIGGRRAGLTDEEINRIKEGSDLEKLDVFDEVLIQSADELYRNASLSDLTWETLSKPYTTHQLIDLVFTVTSYNLLGMFLNSFGIQTEDCIKKMLE
jgi:alkylhydroperoxidase family enzyme